MLRAVYPGSFDPVTNGHMDIIERASKIVDELIVGVLENPYKTCLFPVEERIKHLEMVTNSFPNVKILSFKGLLVDFAKQVDAKVVIRGLRTVTDFENEFKMALTNRSLNPDLETLFISANPKHLYTCSSSVKEVVFFGGNVDFMVPCEIKQLIIDKYRNEG